MSSEMRKQVTAALLEAEKILFASFGTKFLVNDQEEIGVLENHCIRFQRTDIKLTKGDMITDLVTQKKYYFVEGVVQSKSDALLYYIAWVKTEEEIQDQEESPSKPSV